MSIQRPGRCCVFILVASVSLSAITEDQTMRDWQTQHDDLQQQIDAAGLAKSLPLADHCVADVNALILPGDRTPTDVILRRTEAMLESFSRMRRAPTGMGDLRRRLDALKSRSSASGDGLGKSAATSDVDLFMEARGLQRTTALSNPLLDFDTILFVQHMPGWGQAHMVDQYMGCNVNPGGGLYMVTGFRAGGESTARVIDILANSTVTNGRLAGQRLTGGSFLSPDLSYDGTTIAFAWTNDWCYHIFRVNTDGTNLVQLTDGEASYNQRDRSMDASQNEFDPCWLPNGRIVFISERRGGYGRCHTWEKPTWTLYSMKDDGTDIIPISYHETNEWHPSVNNDGMIVYTRWDYLDRDDCIAHHMWTCYPDGRDPRAPHGNYPLPLSTIPGTPFTRSGDGRGARPNGEWNIRAIPNTGKYVATAANHHSKSYGHLVIIDPSIPDDGGMSQVTGITSTPSTWWDAWGSDEFGGGIGPYGTAWPLSEEYFLCNKMNTIILRDILGNEDVICRVDEGRALDPIPLRPRPKPPILPTATWQGERTTLPDHKRATISIMDVNYSDLPLPAGTNIAAIRIMQVIPKATPNIQEPDIGYAAEALARMSLGTAPVEQDGSAYFEAPVGKEIYFQLLDDQGMAVQSMRAGTYVHAGEQMTCYGCHEDKWTATPPPTTLPAALRRPPSTLTPEPGAEDGGVTPINYYRLVKPVFDSKCAPCHRTQGQGPDMGYASLKGYAFRFCGDGDPFINGDIKTPVYGGSRSIPGYVGARYASLTTYCSPSHYDVSLTPEELGRITLWLDGNSNELSAYTRVSEQRSGQLVWPELDFSLENPTGVETSFPAPGGASQCYPLSSTPGLHGIRFMDGGVRVNGSHDGALLLRFYDYRGRLCATRNVAGGEIVYRSDLGLAQGLYLVRLHTPNGKPVADACRVTW